MFCGVITRFFSVFIFCGVSVNILAENLIDTQRSDAPELAAYGQYAIGVKTLEIIHAHQLDILKIDIDEHKLARQPKYDRPLTLEV
jgi:hypothetical protein